jgi:uncharacterized protein YfdQ (DUF2303 family)
MAEGDIATTEAEVVADLARLAQTPEELDPSKAYVLVVKDGEAVEELDLEHLLESPRRASGTYTPADVLSFMHYVQVHAVTEHTTIWVDQLAARIVAVINDHGESATGFGDHRVALQLVRTPEWSHWLAADGKYLTQEQFAEHLQDGIMEIRDPDAATMLEIAQTIQGKTNADWKSAVRLDNGQVGFAYQEEVAATAGRAGNMEIPATLALGIAPFYGEAPFEIGARLRYRIREGNLSIGYKLERPGDVELNVLKDIRDRLTDEAGFERVYMGVAPA